MDKVLEAPHGGRYEKKERIKSGKRSCQTGKGVVVKAECEEISRVGSMLGFKFRTTHLKQEA